MRTWSDRPFGPEIAVEMVAGQGAVVSYGGGESQLVYEIGSHPGWLVKQYLGPAPEDSVAALRRLIDLPGTMAPEDLALVDRATAWPVSRVVAQDSTVGVVMAKAPDYCYAGFRAAAGRTVHKALLVDHLATSAEQHHRWGLPALSVHDRLTVVRSIVEVANLIESHGLVYGDWSYSNAFWSPRPLGTFVIDVDSCRFGSRPWVETRTGAFSDPLLTVGQPVTALHDRYRIALLSLRCLTGVRDVTDVAALALPEPLQDSALSRLLKASLLARSATSRPSLQALLIAADEALALTCVVRAEDLAAAAERERIANEIEANVIGYLSLRTGEVTPAGRNREVAPTAGVPAVDSPRPGRELVSTRSSWLAAGAAVIVIILVALLIWYFG